MVGLRGAMMNTANPFAPAVEALRDPIRDQAAATWAKFSARQRRMVGLGIFPAELMAEAHAALRAAAVPERDLHRLLAVALMDLARERHGGRGVQPALLCVLVLVAGMLHGCADRPVAGSLVSAEHGRCVYVSTEGEGYFTRPAPCAARVRL